MIQKFYSLHLLIILILMSGVQKQKGKKSLSESWDLFMLKYMWAVLIYPWLETYMLSATSYSGEFLTTNGIKSHFQFLCVVSGPVGMRVLPWFCIKCYNRAIYHCPKPGEEFIIESCINAAAKNRKFLYRKFHCEKIKGERASHDVAL